MRPVRTILSFSDSTFASKVLQAELREEAFDHQRLRLVTTHSARNEQEDFVPDFASLVGQVVRIELEDQSLPGEEAPQPTLLFEGYLSRSSLGYEPGGLTYELEAVSGSAGLDGVPRTRLFVDTTLQTLVETLLADYRGGSLETIDINLGALGNKQISFAAQWGETDWGFLRRLCRKFGLFLVARNRNLYLHGSNPFEALQGMEAPIDLALGSSLRGFRLGLASLNRAIQASSYQPFGEQGLDPSRGDQAEETRTWTGPSEETPPASVLAQQVPASTSSIRGAVVENDDHFSQQEFDAIAGRWAQRRVTEMVQGSGESNALGLGVGSLAHIAPAVPFAFEALHGDRFLVTRARHRLQDGVYSADFEVCAEGAPPLLDPADSTGAPDARLMSAQVTDACDPSRLGRVAVRLAPFAESELSTEFWARCLLDGSGESHGTLNLPEIGDEVIVLLDPRAFTAPLALGAVYNGAAKSLVDAIPAHVEVDSSKLTDNHLKYYLSKAGTCIVHDTTDGEARLVVATPNTSVTLSEQSPASFAVQVGGGTCLISGDENGDLTIKAKNITIEADEALSVKSGSNTKVEAGQALEMSSSSDMKMDAGAKLSQSSKMDLEQKAGMNLKAEAKMNFETKGGMMAKHTASLGAEVNGGLQLTLKGAIVMIN